MNGKIWFENEEMNTVNLIWSDNYRERPMQRVPAITDYFPSVLTRCHLEVTCDLTGCLKKNAP